MSVATQREAEANDIKKAQGNAAKVLGLEWPHVAKCRAGRLDVPSNRARVPTTDDAGEKRRQHHVVGCDAKDWFMSVR